MALFFIFVSFHINIEKTPLQPYCTQIKSLTYMNFFFALSNIDTCILRLNNAIGVIFYKSDIK